MAEQTGAFDHPTHGSFKNADDVLASKLSDAEKKTVLSEWHSSLQHVLRNNPDAPAVKERSEELHKALQTL